MGVVTSKATCSRCAGRPLVLSDCDADGPFIGIFLDSSDASPLYPSLTEEHGALVLQDSASLPKRRPTKAVLQAQDSAASPKRRPTKAVLQPESPRAEKKAAAVASEEPAPVPPSTPATETPVKPAAEVRVDEKEGTRSTAVPPSAPAGKAPPKSAAEISPALPSTPADKAPPKPAAEVKKPKAKRKPKEPPSKEAEVLVQSVPPTKRSKEEAKVYKRKSFLQRYRDEQAQRERDKEKNMKLTEDIMAGKFRKEGGGQPGGDLRIKMPTPTDRANTRIMILGQFRAQFGKITANKERNKDCPSAASAATNGYSSTEVQALKIVGGHQPLPRPDNVALPKDFRKLLPGGTLSLQKLGEHGCDSPVGGRMLCSVYGDIFDVTDRPDKYGPDGPYSWMTGNDITWGFVSGKDVPETVNKMYDLWKVAPESFRDSKLKLIYAWVAFYEFEYGNAVGKIDDYVNEAALKGPPMEESEDCCIM